MIFHKHDHIHGEITIPGDKSISHRSLMLGSIAEGTSVIQGCLESADCLATMDCMRKMGITLDKKDHSIYVAGKGLHGLQAPASILDAANSGTTMRLISGILCGQSFSSVITGDSSLVKRPMKRIITPLSLMGADIFSIEKNDCAPLAIIPSRLHGMQYTSPTASAQIKSSILLAGLYAEEPVTVTEPARSRNHSEIMLSAFGASIHSYKKSVTVAPCEKLFSQSIIVPGDISSAAYFIAAALITPHSSLLIKNVGINSTRDGFLRTVMNMGGKISIENKHSVCGELVADLNIESSTLHGTVIEGDIIPTMIDELPIAAVLGAYATGTTTVRNAAELKVKESNRIQSITDNLIAMGGDITPTEDGFIIHGGKPLHGSLIQTNHDHRIAMSFAIASLIADGETLFDDFNCVNISYPDFYHDFASIVKQ